MKKTITLLLIFTSSVFFSQVPSYVPTNGLVGWWPFTGNANDLSGNGNNGTNNGATLTTDRFGNTNSAYSFDGTTNEIAITNSFLMLNADFTISCWMNSIDISKISQCLFNSIDHTGFVVVLNNDIIPPNKLMYGVGPTITYWDLIYAQGSYNLYQNNTWYNVIFKKTNTTYELYVNNVFDGSTVVSLSNNYTQSVGLRIGSIGPIASGGEFFKGKLDDFGIWNRALTQQEITNLYNASLSTEDFAINTINIYPNPATTLLNFKSAIQVEKILIYNMLGQLVQEEKVNALEGTINIEKLVQGTYLVKVNNIDKGYTIIKN